MPGTNYLNKEIARKQINRINIINPTVEQLLKDDALVDRIIEKEVERIEEFQEDLFIRCGNKLFKPTVQVQKKDQVDFSYDPIQTQEICGDNLRSLFHFHGIYPGYHSLEDLNAHKELFQHPYYFEEGSVAGIDGIHVYTHKGHWFKIPYSDEVYDKLKKRGHIVFEKVKNVNCFQMPNKKHECTISLGDGLGDHTIIANEFTYEDPSIQDAVYPIHLVDAKSTNKKVWADFAHRNTMCIAMHKPQNNQTILSCFHRDV